MITRVHALTRSSPFSVRFPVLGRARSPQKGIPTIFRAPSTTAMAKLTDRWSRKACLTRSRKIHIRCEPSRSLVSFLPANAMLTMQIDGRWISLGVVWPVEVAGRRSHRWRMVCSLSWIHLSGGHARTTTGARWRGGRGAGRGAGKAEEEEGGAGRGERGGKGLSATANYPSGKKLKTLKLLANTRVPLVLSAYFCKQHHFGDQN